MRSHLAQAATTGPYAPLANLLLQLGTMVESLDDMTYCAERARGVSGSIGSHVRHCLDHVAAFVAGARSGAVEYDSRLRGTLIEARRDAALAEMRRLEQRLGELPADILIQPVQMLTSLDGHGAPLLMHSSVARELAFVVSHTIHHFAVIALLLRDLGIGVPARFGYAPSTPTRDASARCA